MHSKVPGLQFVTKHWWHYLYEIGGVTYQLSSSIPIMVGMNFWIGSVYIRKCVHWKRMEQKINIKFYIKFVKLATEKDEKIKSAFSNDAMSYFRVFEWFLESSWNEFNQIRCSGWNKEKIQHVQFVMTSDCPLWLVQSIKMCCIGFWSECCVWCLVYDDSGNLCLP